MRLTAKKASQANNHRSRIKPLCGYAALKRGMAWVLSIGLALVCCSKLATPGQAKLVPLGIFAIEALFAVMGGRRHILELGAILIFAAIAVRPERRKSVRFWAPIGVFVLVFFMLLSPFFLALRKEIQFTEWRTRRGGHGVGDILEAMPKAVDLAWEMWQRGDAQKNVVERAGVQEFNFDIAGQQRFARSTDMMMGQALLTNVIWVVPTFLYPAKVYTLQPEATIQAFMGLEITDQGSNWPAYGLADFGPIGGFVAGIAFGVLLVLGHRIATWASSTGRLMLGSLVLGVALHCAIFVDSNPMTILEGYRALALLSVPMLALHSLQYRAGVRVVGIRGRRLAVLRETR